ncbi:gliding motility protein GldC [Aureibacter tunicatorum]|uniref:Gliding motility-associated protein GldC n=1 Tax=Aureibacter tunicatorum TaxID=866807 RepID=A0AAE4BTF8_9BACT|nr:gliding motility protein GldC [Aureibacter tunicatorum]MDR6239890.1 gliding motility-associated protein GldC [Aureibacter tunicatorum]BDD04365.1 gliding motility protein GldC [Aureibacter tunicatorum]
MTEKDISIKVSLDKDNIPEDIKWNATDASNQEAFEDAKAINLSIWDPKQNNTLRIDLWTKEMQVDEMKRFYVDCIGGMAQSILNSTGDEIMAKRMNDLCEELVEHIKKEMQQNMR